MEKLDLSKIISLDPSFSGEGGDCPKTPERR